MRSAASLSVSRLAVPLPMAIKLTPCFEHSLFNVCKEPSQSRRGSCGYTVAVSISLPVASTTATLTPVRIPGSKPNTTRGPAGAANNKSRRLSAKTLIATFSASSRKRANKSRSSDKLSLTRQVHRMVLRRRSSEALALWDQPKCNAIRPSANAFEACAAAVAVKFAAELPMASGSGKDSLASKNSKARPRNTANARCDGTRPMGSL